MKKPSAKPFDWKPVEEAMRRFKLGRPVPGDQELVNFAYKHFRAEYTKRHRKVVALVIDEIRGMFLK